MLDFVAALLTVVMLATIANMLDQGVFRPTCHNHKWVTNDNAKRKHYLICSECGREPIDEIL